MRIFLLLLSGALLASASFAWADPAGLLSPDNPAVGSGWHVPGSPLHGVETFTPAEPKNWIDLNQAVTPKGSGSGKPSMPGMGGMK